MYIEVKGIEDIDNQELYDYHFDLIKQFKNEYEYAFNYECPKAGNFEVVFEYDYSNCKVKLISIEKLRFVHDRIVLIYPRMKKWF